LRPAKSEVFSPSRNSWVMNKLFFEVFLLGAHRLAPVAITELLIRPDFIGTPFRVPFNIPNPNRLAKDNSRELPIMVAVPI